MARTLNDPLLRTVRDAAATVEAVVLFAAPVIAGTAFVGYVMNRSGDNGQLLIAALTMAGLLTAGAGVGLWHYLTKICDPAPYEILESKGELTIEPMGSHHRYSYERSATIRATRNNVRLVEHRSHWTGSGSKNRRKVESLVLEHQVFIGRHTEEDGRQQVWIYLGEPLGRGEEACVRVREVFEDNNEPMRPHFRKGGGRFKTRNLTVVARFVSTEAPADVDALIWNNDRKSRDRATVGTVPYERKLNTADGTVDYEIFVAHPKRYRSYGFRWKWPASQPLSRPSRLG